MVMPPSPKTSEREKMLTLLTNLAKKIRRISNSDKNIHLVFGLPRTKKKPSPKQEAARQERGDDLIRYSKFCIQVKKEAARRNRELRPGHLAKICQTVWRDMVMKDERDEKKIERKLKDSADKYWTDTKDTKERKKTPKKKSTKT